MGVVIRQARIDTDGVLAPHRNTRFHTKKARQRSIGWAKGTRVGPR